MSWWSAHEIRSLRERLGRQFVAEVEEGREPRAALFMESFLDTWPLAALAEPALKAWPSPRSLTILSRLVAAYGLDGTTISLPVPSSLPPHRVVEGAELAAQSNILTRALARGEIEAVVVSAPVPEDGATGLALWEIRLEGGAHQTAVERHGVVGLVGPEAPRWNDLLATAPSGVPGELLRTTGQALILPGTPSGLAGYEAQATGWLLWEAAIRPVAIVPEAVVLLQALPKGLEAACSAARLASPRAREMVSQLVSLGALSAAPDVPSGLQ